MRLIVADVFFRNYPELAIEPYINAPTVEINTNDVEYKAYCKGLEDGKKIARPQGEWISQGTGGYFNPGKHCSLCRKVVEFSENFCPGCGADMRGDNNA